MTNSVDPDQLASAGQGLHVKISCWKKGKNCEVMVKIKINKKRKRHQVESRQMIYDLQHKKMYLWT